MAVALCSCGTDRLRHGDGDYEATVYSFAYVQGGGGDCSMSTTLGGIAKRTQGPELCRAIATWHTCLYALRRRYGARINIWQQIMCQGSQNMPIREEDEGDDGEMGEEAKEELGEKGQVEKEKDTQKEGDLVDTTDAFVSLVEQKLLSIARASAEAIRASVKKGAESKGTHEKSLYPDAVASEMLCVMQNMQGQQTAVVLQSLERWWKGMPLTGGLSIKKLQNESPSKSTESVMQHQVPSDAPATPLGQQDGLSQWDYWSLPGTPQHDKQRSLAPPAVAQGSFERVTSGALPSIDKLDHQTSLGSAETSTSGGDGRSTKALASAGTQGSLQAVNSGILSWSNFYGASHQTLGGPAPRCNSSMEFSSWQMCPVAAPVTLDISASSQIGHSSHLMETVSSSATTTVPASVCVSSTALAGRGHPTSHGGNDGMNPLPVPNTSSPVSPQANAHPLQHSSLLDRFSLLGRSSPVGPSPLGRCATAVGISRLSASTSSSGSSSPVGALRGDERNRQCPSPGTGPGLSSVGSPSPVGTSRGDDQNIQCPSPGSGPGLSSLGSPSSPPGPSVSGISNSSPRPSILKRSSFGKASRLSYRSRKASLRKSLKVIIPCERRLSGVADSAHQQYSPSVQFLLPEGYGQPRSPGRSPTPSSGWLPGLEMNTGKNQWDIAVRAIVKRRRRQNIREKNERLSGVSRRKYIGKSQSARARLREILSGHFLFSDLETRLREELVDAFQDLRVPQSIDIVKEGQIVEHFYVVDIGELEILKSQMACQGQRFKGGDCFGDVALMYDSHWNMTVRSATSVLLWAVDRVTFKRILLLHLTESKLAQVLRETPSLRKLSTQEVVTLANQCTTETYHRGDHIVRSGSVLNKVYVIQEGHVKVTRSAGVTRAAEGRGSGTMTGITFSGEMVALMPRLSLVGESCILSGESICPFNFVAASEQVVLVGFDRKLLSSDMLQRIKKRLQIQLLTTALLRVPALAELNEEQLESLADLFTETHHSYGTTITHHGDRPTHIYVVQSGQIHVSQPPKPHPREKSTTRNSGVHAPSTRQAQTVSKHSNRADVATDGRSAPLSARGPSSFFRMFSLGPASDAKCVSSTPASPAEQSSKGREYGSWEVAFGRMIRESLGVAVPESSPNKVDKGKSGVQDEGLEESEGEVVTALPQSSELADSSGDEAWQRNKRSSHLSVQSSPSSAESGHVGGAGTGFGRLLGSAFGSRHSYLKGGGSGGSPSDTASPDGQTKPHIMTDTRKERAGEVTPHSSVLSDKQATKVVSTETKTEPRVGGNDHDLVTFHGRGKLLVAKAVTEPKVGDVLGGCPHGSVSADAKCKHCIAVEPKKGGPGKGGSPCIPAVSDGRGKQSVGTEPPKNRSHLGDEELASHKIKKPSKTAHSSRAASNEWSSVFMTYAVFGDEGLLGGISRYSSVGASYAYTTVVKSSDALCLHPRFGKCHVSSARQHQCHVSNSATSVAVPHQQQCHISNSATSAVPRQQQYQHQQCPATMTVSALGMPGQLASESIDEYRQWFLAQLALIEAELGKLSCTGGEATPPLTPPDTAALLAASYTSGENADVANRWFTYEDYAVHLVPPLDQPLHVQSSTACTVSSPSTTDLAALPPTIAGDSASWSRLQRLDPLTFVDLQWMPLPPTGRLPKPHCNMLMAQLRDYLHNAVPASLMDAGVEVVNLHDYVAKIDREFKTERYDDIDAPLLYIRIQIGEATCTALIDCGATRNYMSQDFWYALAWGHTFRGSRSPRKSR
ncbi:hypothetical protein CBR_g30159 [Chara braunii]|uniref:Cyclic nucleotide-binding domain-containing protein n=1 Tax=Chara braunii TaxID=69332 RepID=A0A388LC85_CHABU|nr:hypothetical protein CBR_g30159 [Chara braunii]|eukprot:GBG79894.1 hypothetical protein CBR_g30159 [Chara braunii]